MITRILALGALLTASASQAATISYAADNQPVQPTLVGSFDQVSNTTNITDVGPTETVFLVDPDGGGPTAATLFNADLTLAFELTYILSNEAAPGLYSHIFSLTGFFEFRDEFTNDLLIRGDVGAAQAVMSGTGTDVTVFSGLITGFNIDYTIGVAVEAIIGLSGNVLGDFGFTLTAINGGSGADLIYDGDVIVGIEAFDARSSFSGFIVPAPGAAVLGGMGLLTMVRRRR